jgi:hypothetical protein
MSPRQDYPSGRIAIEGPQHGFRLAQGLGGMSHSPPQTARRK